MATQESDITFEQVLEYFRDNGGSVRNRDVVTSFKKYLTDPLSKDDARIKFKEYVNKLAVSKVVNGEKFLYLKTRYLQYQCPSSPVLTSPRVSQMPRAPPPPIDQMNSIGIPVSPLPSPSQSLKDFSTSSPRQPPPYRPPPPVLSPSPSLDTLSMNSFTLSIQESGTPQPPPRRKSVEKFRTSDDDSGTPTTPTFAVEMRDKEPLEENREEEEEGEDNEANVSVKERTQKFNRLASVEGEERSPRCNKTPDRVVKKQGADDDDGASVISNLDPKKCVEWYVTASKGDCQELLKLAKDEPRLVNKKDPFTANVLHWGAKHGNAEIIKIFAGTYKVDVNSKTNGGYTPLHIAAQFGHKDIFKLLIEVYKANSNVRDYSGRTPEYYLLAKEQTGPKNNVRKIKRGKKQSDKDLGFLRIGSLNVRVKKTTEAFSNFLGVGSGSVSSLDGAADKLHKGWGSADNVNTQEIMQAPKGYIGRKKSKYSSGSISNSTPTTPKQSRGMHVQLGNQDSDSDTAAGFDNQWKK
ncbi:ankyrin repeat domain-containing protein SOWAHC isoform X2 [Coccinella septempunctata]|uniref:ankyrin repeat domain-containing protein SOWAHC isoform X2 n=1 Tax=Coccinella septempunctata TaxID=41139 RepID=UPI001D07E907|nr:ankyrin repeat domain-containing protein SOWAHC isoform X2 [Coccinella septempunctata]